MNAMEVGYFELGRPPESTIGQASEILVDMEDAIRRIVGAITREDDRGHPSGEFATTMDGVDEEAERSSQDDS